VAIRFVNYKSDIVHYHANFALYINGERDPFKGFTFYEEVQSCVGDEANNPKSRVHLHNNEPYVVHVHDKAATWGHLFANLGYSLGNNLVKTDKGVYAENSKDNQLTFLLNGQVVDGVANRLIESEDTLLINFGKADSAVLQKRFDDIPRDAEDYNHKPDPAACSGDRPATFTDRLKQAAGF
jgi:hypothetical protein